MEEERTLVAGCVGGTLTWAWFSGPLLCGLSGKHVTSVSCIRFYELIEMPTYIQPWVACAARSPAIELVWENETRNWNPAFSRSGIQHRLLATDRISSGQQQTTHTKMLSNTHISVQTEKWKAKVCTYTTSYKMYTIYTFTFVKRLVIKNRSD